MVHRAPGRVPSQICRGEGTHDTRAATHFQCGLEAQGEILAPGKLWVLSINTSRKRLRCKRAQCLSDRILMSPDLAQRGAGRVFPGGWAELLGTQGVGQVNKLSLSGLYDVPQACDAAERFASSVSSFCMKSAILHLCCVSCW